MIARHRNPKAGEFSRAARGRGLKRDVIRALESAASEVFPDRPEVALEERECFERAATQAIIGDAGNLELSFQLVDKLATAVEVLGLARASDVPDPFRRVWIENTAGDRRRGVVLRREGGEIAIFCPPSDDTLSTAGEISRVSYRGFDSSVEFELRLIDAVRLPQALVLHLTRPFADGAIGRDEQRVTVDLRASVRVLGATDHPDWVHWNPCEVLDLSAGGMHIASELAFSVGRTVDMDVVIPDGGVEALSVTAEVCWSRADEQGLWHQGLRITSFGGHSAARYAYFVAGLIGSSGGSEAEVDRVFAALPQEASSAAVAEPESHDLPPQEINWTGDSEVVDAAEETWRDEVEEGSDASRDEWSLSEPIGLESDLGNAEAELQVEFDGVANAAESLSSDDDWAVASPTPEAPRATDRLSELELELKASADRERDLKAQISVQEFELDNLRNDLAEGGARESRREQLHTQALQVAEDEHQSELQAIQAAFELEREQMQAQIDGHESLRKTFFTELAGVQREAEAIEAELQSRIRGELRERREREQERVEFEARITSLEHAVVTAQSERSATEARLVKTHEHAESLEAELLHRTRWRRKLGRLVGRFTEPGA